MNMTSPLDWNPVRILLLSDFHFSVDHRWEQDAVLRGLIPDIQRAFLDKALAPDLVVVTGDIAQSGRREEYEQAALWFQELLQALGLPPTELFLVPGNHDVSRGESEKRLLLDYKGLLAADRESLDRDLASLLSDDPDSVPALRRHRPFLESSRDLGTSEPGAERPWWRAFREIRGLKLGISGLCSSLFSHDKDEKGRLLIGLWQVEQVLGGREEVDLQVTALHHPLEYLHEKDDSAGDIRRRSGVLLSGHLHSAEIDEVVRTTTETLEARAGACYQGARWPNAFLLLELDPLLGKARVHLRRWEASRWQAWRMDEHPEGVVERALRRSPKARRQAVGSRPLIESAVQVIHDLAFKHLEQEHTGLREFMRSGRYSEALTGLRALEVRLRTVVQDPGASSEMRSLLDAALLNQSKALLNMGHPDKALSVLQELAPAAMKPEHRLNLARLLVLCGQPEQAVSLGESGLSASDSRTIAQLAEIVHGRVPSPPLADDPDVRMALAQLLLTRGDLEGATETAATAWESSQEPSPILTLVCFDVLFRSLSTSVLAGETVPRPVPETRRETLIALLEAMIERDSWPEEQRDLMRWQAAAFYREFLLEKNMGEKLGKGIPDPPAERMEAVPPHPRWYEQAERAFQLWGGDPERSDEAISSLMDVARAWPGRLQVELNLTQLLQYRGRWQDSLEHAEAAFRALPSRFCRLLLCLALHQLGRMGDAWSHLQDEKLWGHWATPDSAERRNRMVWLRVRARTAEYLQKDRLAEELWRALREHPEVTAVDIVAHSFVLERLGERSEATLAAREALIHVLREWEGNLGGVSLVEIGHCCRLLAAQVPIPADDRELLTRVSRDLKARFPADPQTESLRFQLALRVEMSETVAPVDLPLLEGAGMMQRAPLDQIAKHLAEEQRSWLASFDAYKRGFVNYETFSSLRGANPVGQFLLIAGQVQVRETPFIVPIGLDAQVQPVLAGATLILGIQELALLDELGLLGDLDSAIGAQGRFALFGDALASLYSEVVALSARTHPRERAEAERVEQFLQQHVQLIHRSAPSREKRRKDEDEAQALDIPVVYASSEESEASKASQGWTSGMLIYALNEVEPLPAELRARFKPARSPEGAPRPLPGRVALTWGALDELVMGEAMPFLLRATQVWLLGESEENRRERLHGLRDNNEKYRRASGIHEWIAERDREGRLVRLDRAREAARFGLPKPVEKAEARGEFFVRVGERIVSWYGPLLDGGHTLLVTADGVVATLGAGIIPDALRLPLAWDASSTERVRTLLKSCAPALLPITRLIDALEIPMERGRAARRKLLELGYFDAKGALAELLRQYGTVARGEPDRLLGRLEGRGLHPGHFVDVVYRRVLAMAYGQALVQLAVEPSNPWEKTERLLAEMLDRCEGLDGREVGWLHALLMGLILSTLQTQPATDELVRLIKEESPGEFRFSDESARRIRRLWQGVAAWAVTGSRRRSLGLALRTVLSATLLLTRDEGFPMAIAMAWHMAIMEPVLFNQSSTFSNPAGGVQLNSGYEELIAILSALERGWPETVFSFSTTVGEQKFGQSELLDTLSVSFHSENFLPHAVFDGRNLVAVIPLRDLGGLRIEAPLESVVLRLPEGLSEKLWHEFARQQGPLDGRLPEVLDRLRRSPSDPETRREYAYLALNAPFRLVQDSPGMLSALHLATLGAQPLIPDLATLRLVLSEPPEGSDSDSQEDLGRRITDGYLMGRPDRFAIIERLALMPGPLSISLVHQMAAQEPARAARASACLSRLGKSRSWPVGRLYADILYVSLVAHHQPRQLMDGQPVDLRESLPGVFAKMLKEEETGVGFPLARAEPFLLRVCMRIVDSLATRESKPVAQSERIWLTWSLYHWFIGAIGSRQPDWESLARLDSPMVGPQEAITSLLDPRDYGLERYPHRLVFLLQALMGRTVLDIEARVQDPPSNTGAPFIQGELAAELVRLVERPPSQEELRRYVAGEAPPAWGPLVTVRDLALFILLVSDSGRLREIAAPIREEILLRLLSREPDAAARMLLPAYLIALGELREGLSGVERLRLEELVVEGHPLVSNAMRLWFRIRMEPKTLPPLSEADLEDMLVALEPGELYVETLGLCLNLLATEHPERFRPFMERLLSREPPVCTDALILALGPSAREHETARQAIRDLRTRPDVGRDERVLVLFAALRLD